MTTSLRLTVVTLLLVAVLPMVALLGWAVLTTFISCALAVLVPGLCSIWLCHGVAKWFFGHALLFVGLGSPFVGILVVRIGATDEVLFGVLGLLWAPGVVFVVSKWRGILEQRRPPMNS